MTTPALPDPHGPGDAAFDGLVADRLAHYTRTIERAADRAATVTAPHHVPDPCAKARAERHETHTKVAYYTVLVTMIALLAAMSGTSLVGADVAADIAAFTSVAWGVTGIATVAMLQARAERSYRASVGPTVEVPRVVADAYRSILTAPAMLRKLDASEAVVAVVDDQQGYACDLMAAAARLHESGASDSDEARTVRGLLIDMAAHADALVLLAEQRAAAYQAAAVADPYLLTHRPDPTAFTDAARALSAETALARTILGHTLGADISERAELSAPTPTVSTVNPTIQETR